MSVMLDIQYHKASDVMAMKVGRPVEGSLDFADANFRATCVGNDFGGAGLYACFFRDRLLYVGKFLGKKSDFKNGNVVGMRWIKHIGTFTMRARNLGFTRAALRDINAFRHEDPLVPPNIQTAFDRANPAVLQRETGCMSTLRRFKVAANLYAETSGKLCLNDFCFLYARLETAENNLAVRTRVSQAETRLLQRIQPPGNTVREPRPCQALSPADVRRLFEEELNCEPGPAVMLTQERRAVGLAPSATSEPEEIGCEAQFAGGIETAPDALQDILQELVQMIEDTDNAEVNYTEVPDMRIRTYGSRGKGFINSARIRWQPRLGRILLNTKLPAEILGKYGLSVDRPADGRLMNETFLPLSSLTQNRRLLRDVVMRAHSEEAVRIARDKRSSIWPT